MADAFVRRDIWHLESEVQPWDETTVWYARAVKEMKRRSTVDPDDPTGWTYQAAIHGSRVEPRDDTERRIWNQCQHATWYFLPWHRMYLYYFERIARSIVVSHGGPADWALPYWNYSRGGDSARLPPAFRSPRWSPDGTVENNPLYVSRRRTANYNVNKGAPLPEPVIAFDSSVARVNFTATSPITPSFGGPRTGFAHHGPGFGALEGQPHNVVHTAVGGPGGLMSDPDTAALDPIFWLHHANIDRLWEYWLSLGGGRRDPADAAWLDRRFTLPDVGGARASRRVSEVLSTSRLNYRYDDQPARAQSAAERPPVRTAAEESVREPRPTAPERQPRLVAASSAEVTLTGRASAHDVPLDAKAVTAMRAVAQGARDALGAKAATADAHRQPRFYLALEGLEAEEAPGEIYQVYLKPSPESTDAYLVGNMTFFGAKPHRESDVESAVEPDEEPDEESGHPAGPLAHSFDITDIVRRLQEAGDWDGTRVTVFLNPLGAAPQSVHPHEPDPTVAPHPPASIKRISIFQA